MTSDARTPWTFRIALACGLLPLLVGTLIYAIFVGTENLLMMTFGLLNIYAGMALFVVGLVCTALYFFGERSRGVGQPKLGVRTTLLLAVLLINFPVAGALAYSALDIATTYHVEVRNESDEPLTNLVLSAPSVELSSSALPPGGEFEADLRFGGDGALMLRYELAGEPREEVIEGYVTGGWGGDALVVRRADGTFSITTKSFGE